MLKFKSSYFLKLFVPAFIVIVSVVIFFEYSRKEHEYTQIKSHEFMHVYYGERTASRVFDNIKKDLSFMTNSLAMKRYLTTPNPSSRKDLAHEFLNLAQSRNLYEQIRFINGEGMEEIRVNYQQGHSAIVPAKMLQNKFKRYYFSGTFSLGPNQIYLSPFDLNVEQGIIEQPFKPMLRIGMPVFDDDHNKRGIFILNYLGAELIQAIIANMTSTIAEQNHERGHDGQEVGAIHKNLLGKPLLVNRDGYWLLGRNPREEWSFMFKGEYSFAASFPGIWRELLQSDTGQVVTDRGIFTFSTIYPLKGHRFSSTPLSPSSLSADEQRIVADYSWKLISFLDPEHLDYFFWHDTKKSGYLLLAILTLLVPACLFLGRIWSQREEAKADLVQAKQDWEKTYDAVPDMIALIDLNYQITRINRSMADRLALRPDECIGQTCYSLVHGLNSPHPLCPLTRLLEDGKIHEQELSEDRLGADFLVTVSPLFNELGNLSGCVHVMRDITASNKITKHLRNLNNLKEKLIGPGRFENKLNLITDYIVEFFEADFARIWILKPGDLCDNGCSHSSAPEPEHKCNFKDRCLHLAASSGRYTHLDGGHKRVPFGCYKIGLIASGNENKFVTNEVTTDPQVHNLEWAEKLGLKSFAGYRLLSSADEPLGVLALFSKKIISPEEDSLLENIANATAQAIRTAKAEESIQQSFAMMKSILDNIDAAVYITDIETYEIIMVNRYVREEFGEVEGRTCWQSIQRGQDGPCEFCKIPELLSLDWPDHEVLVWEVQNTLNGRWYENHDSIIDWIDKRKVKLQIATDLTGRKKIENELGEYASTQQTLLREVNHRVKNNLVALISMLHMEEEKVTSDHSDVIPDVISRLQGLATVHSLLSSCGWQPLSLTVLCKEVIGAALSAVPLATKASLHVQSSAIHVGSEQAHNLALVINELTTNSIKHALEKKDSIMINITMENIADNTVEIIFKDDGPGFPQWLIDGDLEKANVGMEIIFGIINSNLQGEVEFSNNNGGVTRFTFDNSF